MLFGMPETLCKEQELEERLSLPDAQAGENIGSLPTHKNLCTQTKVFARFFFPRTRFLPFDLTGLATD